MRPELESDKFKNLGVPYYYDKAKKEREFSCERPEEPIDYFLDLIKRLRKRAEIRRQIPTRKSVQLGEPDRIADLLEEAATAIERLYDD